MYINNELYLNDIKKIITENFKEFKNKTFFVTGATGLVGSFLVDVLMYLNLHLQYNINIYATFTSLKSAQDRFKEYLNNPNFHILIQNINDPINQDRKFDYIIHTASNTHPKLYAEKPVETMKLNFIGTSNILDFALKSPESKTLFLSTLEVYGEDFNIDLFKESDIGKINFMIPRSCYPESKRACETLCHSYIKEYGLDIRIARLGYIYGPSVKMTSSKADVQFLQKALNKENIILNSDGLQRRSYCYVADTVSALLTILLNGTSGETYNIAAENSNVRLRDVAQIYADLAGTELQFTKPTDKEKEGYNNINNSMLNSKKLQSLDWHPFFTLHEGIQHTLEIKALSSQNVKEDADKKESLKC